MVTVGIVAGEHHCDKTVIVLNTKNVRADLPSSFTSDALMIGADLSAPRVCLQRNTIHKLSH